MTERKKNPEQDTINAIKNVPINTIRAQLPYQEVSLSVLKKKLIKMSAQ